ncbi:ATP-binding cassette domain-containing protein [Kytococcus schroeteri]|uniref:ATP-binding cassette domain-containing protein n=1 Tax=Kytococcus schroeteri TaxID=138300 RepID=UPI0035E6722B
MTELVVDRATIRYGTRTAVEGVSWRRGHGLHGLLGANGAGKSPLLRAVVALQPLDGGSVTLDGAPVRQVRERVGFLPQDNLRRSRFTVWEHLAYMCWLKRLDDRAAASEVDRLLGLVGLEERADDRIRALSGGMRRRVGIASALVADPEVIVLDEPTAGLDMGQRDSLNDLLHRVSQEAIVVISTHIVEDVLDHADTVTVMDQGSFVFDGTFEEFSPTRELSTVRASYLELVAQ